MFQQALEPNMIALSNGERSHLPYPCSDRCCCFHLYPYFANLEFILLLYMLYWTNNKIFSDMLQLTCFRLKLCYSSYFLRAMKSHVNQRYYQWFNILLSNLWPCKFLWNWLLNPNISYFHFLFQFQTSLKLLCNINLTWLDLICICHLSKNIK